MHIPRPGPIRRRVAVRTRVVLACVLLLRAAAAASDPVHPVESRHPAVVVSAGTFALVEDYDYPYRVGLLYRFAAVTAWWLQPGVGAAFGPEGKTYLYVDLQRDFPLGDDWLVSPSLAAGYFANGDAVGVHGHVQFQSGIALARRFERGRRIGLGVYHISNGGLDTPNNGTEAVVTFVRIPVGPVPRGR